MTNILDTSWEKFKSQWAVDGMPADKQRLARAAYECGQSSNRKQVLLEAAEVCEPPAYPNGISEYRGGWADAHEKLHKELRRMAEGEK
jgi:hypothetical protein